MNLHAGLHDPSKLLADLRDHLARHDKPIAFFFGAGTSCAVRVRPVTEPTANEPLIPNVAQLTSQCECAAGALGTNYAQAWREIADQCRTDGQNPNIENILSRLRMMIAAIGESDVLAGLTRVQLTTMEENVRQTIAKIVTPAEHMIPPDLPHHQFARWVVKTARDNPIEIFTVNYDILIELALESELVPVFDGFVGSHRPFFYPESLRHSELAPGVKWTRLWKMHGSVTWRRTTVNGRNRVIRGEPNVSGEMIFPSFRKYDESRQQPYVAFMDRLSRFLELDDALLIVAGFSFGDEHINNMIFGALENHQRTHVYALQYDEPGDGTDLTKRSYQRRNMITVGPETGIIGGRRSRWGHVEGHPFVEPMRDGALAEDTEDGESDPDDANDLFGRMNIGDFSRFCEFLSSMTTR